MRAESVLASARLKRPRAVRPQWGGALAQADAIHRYPAKMALGLASYFFEGPVADRFEDSAPERAIAFDPFAGSGSGLLVARAHGLSTRGIDLLEPSVLISRAKLNRLDEEIAGRLHEFADVPLDGRRRSPVWEWATWRQWYHPTTLRALQELRESIWAYRTTRHFPHLFAALSQTCWDVSGADPEVMVPTHSPRFRGAPKVDVKTVAETFRRRLLRIERAQRALGHLSIPRSAAPVTQGNALDPRAWPRRCAVMFTSPPYGTGIDYVRALSLQWRVLLPDTPLSPARRLLLGRIGHLESSEEAIPRRFRNDVWVASARRSEKSRFDGLCQYLDDLNAVVETAATRLDPTGLFGLVLGDPEVGGRRVPLTEMAREIAKDRGFKEFRAPVKDRIRRRHQTGVRRSSRGPISHETLLSLAVT